MFWTAAIAILAVSALIMVSPLLSKGSNWKAIGLALVIALPAGGAFLYGGVGNPLAMNHQAASTNGGDFNELTDNLASNLTETEEDLEGWLLLGRSLKSLQRFDEALDALQTAQRIAPDNPLVRVELAEAMLFASGNPQINDEVRAMLESAVNDDPGLQKGLWLLGIDAVQRGDDSTAVEYWQRLLQRVEPDSPIAASVQEQIDQALARLGETPTPTPVNDTWPGVTVEVDLGTAANQALDTTSMSPSATLFVVIRAPGMTAGPPLGVARIGNPQFPLTVTLTDSNAMLPQTLLSAQTSLQLKARLSLEGRPIASPGDWESESIEVEVDNPGPHPLSLSTQVE